MMRTEYWDCWNDAVSEGKKQGDLEEDFKEHLMYPVIARYISIEALKHVLSTSHEGHDWVPDWVTACEHELVERELLGRVYD